MTPLSTFKSEREGRLSNEARTTEKPTGRTRAGSDAQEPTVSSVPGDRTEGSSRLGISVWPSTAARVPSSRIAGVLDESATNEMLNHDAGSISTTERGAVQRYNFTLSSRPYSTGSPPTPGRGGTGADVVTLSKECNLVRTRVPPWRGGVTTCIVRAVRGTAR